MAMQIAVGSSASLDSRQAAREAVRSALRSAAHPAFALVLSTDQYDADALVAALSE